MTCILGFNLALLINQNRIGTMSYNGYSSCPLVTDYGKMVLAEFDYAGLLSENEYLLLFEYQNNQKLKINNNRS